jgi:predicted protein tyrosine phosphatase
LSSSRFAAAAAAMAANLEDVPSLDLMHELLRRMKCSSKPDKRLILIGTAWTALSLFPIPNLPPRRRSVDSPFW